MKTHRSIPYAHSSAFTLVEMMFVIVIIGLLAAIAIPGFQRVRKNSQNSAFQNDLRIIEGAINGYIMANKAYPPDVNQGVMPPELAPYLPNMDWSKPTPIGGLWDYDYNWGMTCGIGVLGPARTEEEMSKLGNFNRFGGQYIIVIEP